MMRHIISSSLFSLVSLCGVSVVQAEALDARSSVGVGAFGYAMQNHCCSTPALLTGIDATYDHGLASTLGLRARLGVVALGFDEITGAAPHFEVGGYGRLRLGSEFALEGSLLGGLEYGALDEKIDTVDSELGPTVAAEAAFHVDVGEGFLATLGGGYRLSWAQNQPEETAHGPVVRLSLGKTF